MSERQAAAIVETHGLKVRFEQAGKRIEAVNGVDLSVARGEALALIGESGSGKSVTLRALMRLHPGATRIEGRIEIEGRDLMAMSRGELSRLRGGEVAMVFQEPLTALDPVYTVGQQIVEGLRRHRGLSRSEARAQALEALKSVRIPSPESRLDAYPHEMSGGMRQRAMIALALSCRPRLLLADEPTTALDATVQIQILILLRELRRELGLALVFVTHDIAAAAEVADRVAVMYGGRIVETAPVRELLRTPRHPYTIALLASRPDGGLAKGQRLETIPGSPPDLAALPPGCAFAPRCRHAMAICSAQLPPSEEIATAHRVACHWAMGYRDADLDPQPGQPERMDP